MASPSLLVSKWTAASGNPQVFRLVNGLTLSQVGPDITSDTLESNPDSTKSRPTSRVIQFRNKLYCWQHNSILQLDEGANPTTGDDAWVVVHTLSPAVAALDPSPLTGLHTVNINGTPTLVGFYKDNTTGVRGIKSSDGVNWTTTGALDVETLSVGFGTSIVYRDAIYCIVSVNSTYMCMSYNPVSDTITRIDMNIPHATFLIAGDFCIFKNRLWLLEGINTFGYLSDDIRLWELVGSTFISHTILTGAGTQDSTQGQRAGHCLFVDGNSIICFAVCLSTAGGGSGIKAYELVYNPTSNTFTETEITSAIGLPSTMQVGGLGGAGTGTYWRIFSFTDNETNPLNPKTYLWIGSSGTAVSPPPNNFTVFQWNGPAAALTNLGPGPASGEIALPNTKNGGGDRIYIPGEPDVQITGSTATKPGLELQIDTFGTSITSGNIVRVFFSEGENAPSIPCTLLNPSLGLTIQSDTVGDYVSGVTEGDVFTVVWAFETDGVAPNSNVALFATIERL